MIYWNEEKQAWAFDQVTDVEKQKILDLGFKYVMPVLATNVVKQLMDAEPVHDYGLDAIDKDQMFNA